MAQPRAQPEGVLLASRLLCAAAVKAGLKVQALEEHGMARRGGAVAIQLRLGQNEIHTSEIRPATGHLLLAFEPMEALRALPLVSPGATAVINTSQLPPQPLADKTPTRLDINRVEELLAQHFAPANLHLLDATALAEEGGSTLAVNMVLLGTVTALYLLPEGLDREALEAAMAEGAAARFGEVNQRAFEAGFEAIDKNLFR